MIMMSLFILDLKTKTNVLDNYWGVGEVSRVSFTVCEDAFAMLVVHCWLTEGLK